MARRSAPPPPHVAVAAAGWDGFVDRCGVTTSLALMVAILAMATARVHPSPLSQSLAGPQLLLVLIVLGCIGVLAYRHDGG